MLGTSNYSSALALDAADGVIDGRFYGAPIGVNGGAAYSSATFGAAAYPTAAYQTAAYPTVASAVPATYSAGLTATYGGAYSAGVAAPVYRTPYLGYGYGLTAATSALSYGSYQLPAAYPAYASVVRPVTQYAAQVVVPQVVAPPPVQLIQAAPQIQYVQSPPEVRYIQSPPEVRYIEAPPVQVPTEDPRLLARIRELEAEIAQLRARLAAKAEVRSQTSVHQTYKVKSFEIAAKLALMDGTDDGLYNGLPIEVEGEGLYRDLVAAGRKPRGNVSLTGRSGGSITTTSETYKVQSYEMAEKLSKMDGNDDGKYNGLPIEVAGQGLYTELVRARRAAGWGR